MYYSIELFGTLVEPSEHLLKTSVPSWYGCYQNQQDQSRSPGPGPPSTCTLHPKMRGDKCDKRAGKFPSVCIFGEMETPHLLINNCSRTVRYSSTKFHASSTAGGRRSGW